MKIDKTYVNLANERIQKEAEEIAMKITLMNQDPKIIMDLFFELHQDIPREGPGEAASTRRAFALMNGLPSQPRILDIGLRPRHADARTGQDQRWLHPGNRYPCALPGGTRPTGKPEGPGEADFGPQPIDVRAGFRAGQFRCDLVGRAIYIIASRKACGNGSRSLKNGGYLAVTS